MQEGSVALEKMRGFEITSVEMRLDRVERLIQVVEDVFYIFDAD